MFREKAYGVLWKLAKGLHKTQVKTFVAVCGAFVLSGQARSFAVGQRLARSSGIGFKSGLQRYYRWVGGAKIDSARIWAGLAGLLMGAAGRKPVVAVDWTEWHSRLRVLAAGVCLGKRAIPVLAQTLSIPSIRRSQNRFEDTFVVRLVRLCPLMNKAVLVFDRGFRRVSLIRLLQALAQPFVLRLMVKVHVAASGYAGLLSGYPPRPGSSVDLGIVTLRQHRPVRVRVVGVWAVHQKEPWWLAASPGDAAGTIAGYYDRRMTVEEMFRDSKGARYGLQLSLTRFAQPSALNRLFLLAALAIALCTAAGALALLSDPSLALASSDPGPRRSLFNIGRQDPERIGHILRCAWQRLPTLWRPPQLRPFAWLE
jgi:hypothetical protein